MGVMACDMFNCENELVNWGIDIKISDFMKSDRKQIDRKLSYKVYNEIFPLLVDIINYLL